VAFSKRIRNANYNILGGGCGYGYGRHIHFLLDKNIIKKQDIHARVRMHTNTNAHTHAHTYADKSSVVRVNVQKRDV